MVGMASFVKSFPIPMSWIWLHSRMCETEHVSGFHYGISHIFDHRHTYPRYLSPSHHCVAFRQPSPIVSSLFRTRYICMSVLRPRRNIPLISREVLEVDEICVNNGFKTWNSIISRNSWLWHIGYWQGFSSVKYVIVHKHTHTHTHLYIHLFILGLLEWL